MQCSFCFSLTLSLIATAFFAAAHHRYERFREAANAAELDVVVANLQSHITTRYLGTGQESARHAHLTWPFLKSQVPGFDKRQAQAKLNRAGGTKRARAAETPAAAVDLPALPAATAPAEHALLTWQPQPQPPQLDTNR